jgi:hypothetical protein
LEAVLHPGYIFDFWEINKRKYYDQKVQLNWYLSENYIINAKLFTKPDETYHNIVIKTIIPGESGDTIVLYNPGPNETMAENFYLSNDKENLNKFHIKKVRFPAKSTMIYNIAEFKVKKGETVYLSDKKGTILCEVYIPENFNIYKNEQITRNGDGSYKAEKING